MFGTIVMLSLLFFRIFIPLIILTAIGLLVDRRLKPT